MDPRLSRGRHYMSVYLEDKTPLFIRKHNNLCSSWEKQVLLVEDSAIVAKVTSHFVTKQGCQIKVAPDATSGLAISKTQSFHLILMDIGLPDGSGDQVSSLAAKY
jgi:ActR/RegA family two-component response regulator